MILLTTPLQALGEEYAFRGYLMQAFGSLTHGIAESWGLSRATAARVAVGFALLVTSGLFALAHGTQNVPLFFDRFAFGLMAGLIVVLVGGLEAGIALHILNNLLAFALAIFFGDLQGALTVSEVSWWQLPVTIVQNGVFLVLVLFVARRMGLRNTTTPPAAATVAHRPDWWLTRRVCVSLTLGSPRRSGRADPMGYGVIGSPTGSGPVSLGSSPSTPASTAIWLSPLTRTLESRRLSQQQTGPRCVVA